MGGGTSLSSHRAGFGVFRSKAISKSTAQSAFAWSVKFDDNTHNPLPLGEGGTQCRVRVKKAAFTLAEVLITLAIIGIVAVLTIPTLVQNFQSRAWDTASQVFQRKLEESLKVMNVQATLAGYTTTEDFVNELSKHFKITRICENDEITTCFSDKVYWGEENEEIEMADIKDASNFGHDDWETNTVGVQFANGVTGVIAYNPDCKQDPYSNQITGTSCLAILYDVDGFKNPNTSGKDLRSINVESLGGSSCMFKIGGTCWGTPFQPDSITAADCNANKDKYGIQNCMSGDSDYWGGAMKTCADQGKRLPNASELAALATELYGTPIGAEESNNNLGEVNFEKAQDFGFTFVDLGGGYTLGLWNNVEIDEYSAALRHFNWFGTEYFGPSRDGGARDHSSTYLWAVCVGE